MYQSKIQKETANNEIKIYITAETIKDVLNPYWLFLNYNSVHFSEGFEEIKDDSGLHWVREDFSPYRAYFTTNREKFLKGMSGVFINRIITEKDPYCYLIKEPSPQFDELRVIADKQALDYLEGLPEIETEYKEDILVDAV